MPIREDSWLSERLGRPAFTVARETAPDELAAHAAAAGTAFYQAKVPTDDVAAARTLVGAGFYPVDVNVTLAREPDAAARPERFAVVTAEPGHGEAVLEIAATCFSWSRFHLDPAIGEEAASRVKRDWVASYLAGARGEHLLVAVDAEQPVGFLAVLERADDGGRVRVIDLVGVATAAQGRGAGRDLTSAFLAGAAGCDRVEVGTQAANLVATRLYERMGFVVRRTAYVLHKHVEAP